MTERVTERMTEAVDMKELARAEGDLAAKGVLLPWMHVAVAVGCAVLAWIVPTDGVRAVAFASVLYLPLWGVLVAPRLGRLAWLYTLPEDDDGPDEEDRTDRSAPGPRAHIWGLRISFAVAGGIGAAAAAFVPAPWIRWLLPALAAWAVAEAVRRDRGRYRQAREVRARATTAAWYDDYRALIDTRRGQLQKG